MRSQAAELARRLARDAEAVCRRYLSNGRRQGRYWLVGDIANTPGRSLFVRLTGPESGKGAAGKWTDAATGQALAINRLSRPGQALFLTSRQHPRRDATGSQSPSRPPFRRR